MGVTGKYNFPGIKKASVAGLEAALATTTWGASLIGGPFKAFEEYLLEALMNYLANKGLIVLNLGAIIVEGALDQKAFDKAMDDGITRVELGRDKLSAAQGKAIDDETIAAARKFIRFNPKP